MNVHQQEFERLTAQDAAQAAQAEADKQAAETNLAMREREQAYLRAIEQRDIDKQQAFERLEREVNLCQVFDYRWAEDRARQENPKKPIYTLTGEAMNNRYHASREQAVHIYGNVYHDLAQHAGHKETPHFSTLRRPTPEEAAHILETWAEQGDTGRVKRRRAEKATALRRYIERLDSGDVPAERELHD